MKNKNIFKKLILVLVIIIVILSILLVIGNFKMAPYVSNIEYFESKRFNDKMVLNIYVNNYFFKFDKSTWCLLTKDNKVPDKNSSDWVEASNGYCAITTDIGEYNVYVKDKYGNINSFDPQKIEINNVLDVKMSKDFVYLWKGGKEKINFELIKIGNVNERVIWSSDNEDVAIVDQDGNIEGVNYGTTTIKVVSENGITGETKVVVSNFISKPIINTAKSYVSCKQFGVDEANLIDNILFDRIDMAGYKTRAGVVAAARFLTLEFNYRIPYFPENGRLNNFGSTAYVDGEGRYYHRGLYLNENKYNSLKASLVGPAMWGCDLKTFGTPLPEFKYGRIYPNGLDCSGFVTWALYNGGFDVGDVGAGPNEGHDDLDNIGTKVNITEELMNSGRVKAGDLIGLYGHMAILAGWDDNNYYIAESLNNLGGVVMSTVPKNKLVNNSIYTFIILMGDIYKEDGNYTTMW